MIRARTLRGADSLRLAVADEGCIALKLRAATSDQGLDGHCGERGETPEESPAACFGTLDGKGVDLEEGTMSHDDALIYVEQG